MSVEELQSVGTPEIMDTLGAHETVLIDQGADIQTIIEWCNHLQDKLERLEQEVNAHIQTANAHKL